MWLHPQVSVDDIMDAFEEAGTTVENIQTPAHIVSVPAAAQGIQGVAFFVAVGMGGVACRNIICHF